MKPVRSIRRMSGISLIEILISMAIGLVVVGAVVISFAGSGKAGRYQSALTQMNQDAQIGLNLLSRELQLAGYSAPLALTNVAGTATTANYVVTYKLGTTTAPIFGCDVTRGTTATFNTFANPTAATLTCGASTATPTVSGFGVVYEADAKNTVTAGGVPSDCLGAAIAVTNAGPNAYYVARNRFFIDFTSGAGASGRPELYCASDKAGATKQPLMENVEDMQVWYGLSNGGGSRQVIRYAKAGNGASIANTIGAQGPPAVYDGVEWSKVIAVRICLLLRSAEPILQTGDDDGRGYADCNGESQTSTDGYLRRAYFTTSTLRTKMAF